MRKLNTEIQDVTIVDKYEETPEGYLVFKDVKVSRTGTQKYMGYELGFEPDDDEYMKELVAYRPDSEVFQEESMNSFKNKPVTDEHPWEMVHSSNFKDFTKGITGSNVSKTDTHVVIDTVTIMDSNLVNEYKLGNKREVSMGYKVVWKLEKGETPDGEAYDLIQTEIRGNHLAIVAKGRCGTSCNLSDSDIKPQKPKGSNMDLVTVTIDGLPHKVNDTAKTIIDKLVQDQATVLASFDKFKQDAADAESKLKAEHDIAINAKDEEIKELKKSQVTPELLDAAIKSRTNVIDSAKKFLPEDYTFDGKGCEIIKRDVLVAKLGDKAMEGKDDVYVENAFDALTKIGANSDTTDSNDDEGNPDFFKQANDVGDGKDTENQGRKTYVENLTGKFK